MKENNHPIKKLFRVIGAYKTPMVLGFFLGISLVLGIVLANQVIGNEKKPITIVKETPTHINERINDANDTTVIIETNDDQGTEDAKNSSDNSNENDNANDPGQTVISSDESVEETMPTTKIDKKYFNVLLVGVDQRPGEKSFSNTDTLLLASVNTVDGQVALLSIPRDTQVIIPGYGKEKINAAARVGRGLKTTQTLVEEIIGLPIDGYILTNFTGFKTIIDTLGGITVTVDKDMYYVTGDKEDGVINLKKGAQRLNGTQALQYARFRQDALADITRATRQQTVLKAMEKELLQVKTLPKLPTIISQMSKSVETNLTITQLWSLANILIRSSSPEIISQTLPGNFLIEDNISYWKVNPLKSHAVLKRLIEEGKTTSVFFH